MNDFLAFLSGGGEMGERIRAHDWAATTIGPPETWHQTLQTAIGLLLGAKQPVYVAWGPDLISFYNDGYLPIIGNKHPALGHPFSVLWAEIWEDFRPIVDATLMGEAQHFIDLPIALAGRPGLPVGYFTFSYTALRDELGKSVGLYCAATETTKQVLLEQRTTSEYEQLTQLLAQAPSFMCVLQGPDHRIKLTNRAQLQLVGHRNLIGMTVSEALPEVEGQGFVGLLDQVYETGQPFIGQGLEIDLQRVPGAPLEKAFLNFVYQPIVDHTGAVTGIFVEGFDVTGLKKAEIALRESELKGRLALDAAGIGVWECTIQGQTFANLTGDERAMELLGGKVGERTSFSSFMARIDPEDIALVRNAAMQVIGSGSTGTLDVEFRIAPAAEAPELWIHARARLVALHNSSRLIGTVRDITKSRNSDLQRQLLTEEMGHRIKNILAMVQAISNQTFKGEDIADRQSAFSSRLAALGHANELLMASTWTSASIFETLTSTLDVHRSSKERIVLDGPSIRLGPKQALSLSLSVHELATNAAKYGALSQESGRVQVGWNVDRVDPDGGRFFTFTWQEFDGPSVQVPEHKGFGTRLISRVMAADFGGEVSIEYHSSGVVCTLVCHVDRLV